MIMEEKISVVICVRNEASRIKECIELILKNNPDEVIVVDGNSTDKTLEIVRKFQQVRIIESLNSNLTLDRQKGIDSAKNRYVAMIDADHRLSENDLKKMTIELKENNFCIIQSGLLSFNNNGFWERAEESAWKITHNIPGQKKMIGTAPAIYDKNIFKIIRFEDKITSTIDDTDFMYRLSKFNDLKYGISNVNIRQLHYSDFNNYVKKFIWYGKGDGEFCKKNPERALNMIYHLAFRYPVIYSIKSIFKFQFNAIPFFIIQGYIRLYGLFNYFIKINK